MTTNHGHDNDSSKCFLLDIPPELRLAIYEHLVVADEPIRGATARKDKKYGLDLTILRVNRQIHEESKSLFFGKNTFYVTSIPDAQAISPNNSDTKGEELEAANVQGFNPPLQEKDWPLLHHLTLDLLYYPQELLSEPGLNGSGWKPIDPGATAYINSLTHLLTVVSSKLQSLALTAEVSESFCAKKCLVSFFMCDRDRNFPRALSAFEGSSGGIKSIPVSFEFPDCFYRVEVEPDIFVKRSILLLACQVMFCQSQVRVNELLKAFEEGREFPADGKLKKRIDLGPYVGRTWPTKGDGKALMGIQ